MKKNIIIFTDGSSLGNPGPGGWGAIIAEEETVLELGGAEKYTTNNRMELTAAIEALVAVHENEHVVLHTDSRYVIRGITEWISEWKKRDWMTKQKKPVENRDLWEKLSRLVDAHKILGKISWKHVGGHIGVAGNERADEIATEFARGGHPELFEGKRSAYPVPVNDVSYDEAREEARSRSKTRSRAKAYAYLSLVDGILKRHATWEECEQRVKGVRGVKFKKAVSKEDEDAIRTAWGA